MNPFPKLKSRTEDGDLKKKKNKTAPSETQPPYILTTQFKTVNMMYNDFSPLHFYPTRLLAQFREITVKEDVAPRKNKMPPLKKYVPICESK